MASPRKTRPGTMLGVFAMASAACFGTVVEASISVQVEMHFIETTVDSGYVVLTVTAFSGTAATVTVDCQGDISSTGTSPLRDSTFVAKGTTERVVQVTCTLVSGSSMSEAGASTTIPARPASPPPISSGVAQAHQALSRPRQGRRS